MRGGWMQWGGVASFECAREGISLSKSLSPSRLAHTHSWVRLSNRGSYAATASDGRFKWNPMNGLDDRKHNSDGRFVRMNREDDSGGDFGWTIRMETSEETRNDDSDG